MYQQRPLALVVDGQGGGVGKSVIERLKKDVPQLYVRAVGTNSTATARMMKAGADDGATGENAIVINAQKADFIIGAMGIIMPNAILGELTPRMAEAIGSSDAIRILIPIDKCHTRIALLTEGSLSQYIDRAVEMLLEELAHFE